MSTNRNIQCVEHLQPSTSNARCRHLLDHEAVELQGLQCKLDTSELKEQRTKLELAAARFALSVERRTSNVDRLFARECVRCGWRALSITQQTDVLDVSLRVAPRRMGTENGRTDVWRLRTTLDA